MPAANQHEKVHKSISDGTTKSCEHLFRDAYENGFRNTIATLRRCRVSPDQAEEFAQAAWVRGWERRSQLRDPALLLRWINEIAVNLLRDETRKTRRLTPIFPADLASGVSSAVSSSAIDLRVALSNFPAGRRAFLDALLKDLTPAEIAAELHISVGAVHHRLSRLRAGLRRRLTTH